MRRIFTFSASTAVLLLGLTACASGPASLEGQRSIPADTKTILLDVRTPEEHAAGHLEDATLLDFNSGELAAAISTLKPEAEYLIYCRSGNRSGQAVALMEQAGFTNLTNLGSLEQAAQTTGLPIKR